MPEIIVGVDAGGTKTTLAHRCGDSEPRLLRAQAANAATQGAERAGAVIANLVESVLDGAQPHAIFVGMAGGGADSIAQSVRDLLQSRFERARILVRDDAAIALRANVPEGDGVVLVAGTGSIAYAERGEQQFRAGGFGYLLGDEGGGFRIGATAIGQLLRAYDGRAPHNDLTQAVAQSLGVNDAAQTVSAIYSQRLPVPAIAAVAEVVVQLASAGDRTALKIVQAAAADLGELAKAIVTKAGLRGSRAPIAFAGGLLRGNSVLSYLLETRLLNEFSDMPIVKTAREPVYGALSLAQRLLS